MRKRMMRLGAGIVAMMFAALVLAIPAPSLADEVPTVTYRAHVQNKGWLPAVSDGKEAGTHGESLRLEALTIDVEGEMGIEARAHVQNYGWMKSVGEGEILGTTGESKRVEAITLSLTNNTSGYHIWYRVHVQNYGWLAWAKDGEAAGSQGQSLRLEAIQILILPEGETPSSEGQNWNVPFIGVLDIRAHIQNIGWQNTVHETQTTGTTGRSLRMEAIEVRIAATGDPSLSGGIIYNAHVQNKGWQRNPSDSSNWFKNGETAGTTGESLRVEAYQFKLTGAIAENYDLFYRAHVQNVGWMQWTSNGGMAGTSGMSLRIEAVQFRLVPKNGTAPSNAEAAIATSYLSTPTVSYQAYQSGNWTGACANGLSAGVTGQSKPLTGIKISLQSDLSLGGIEYSSYIANQGWTNYVANGVLSGSEGGNQVEAFKVRLTGRWANLYDVYYRAHIQNAGWLGWAKNDEVAGSTGQNLRVESIEVMIIPKGAAAPGSTDYHEYVPGGWRQEGGHWRYYNGTTRVNFDTNVGLTTGDAGDVVHAMWERYKGVSSRTNYLVLIDWNDCYVGVFKGSANNWVPVRGMNCTTGSGYSPFDAPMGGDAGAVWHRADAEDGWWEVLLTRGHAFHICFSGNPNGDELGRHVSGGVGRLLRVNARWMWNTIPQYTRAICF